ncbi:MAG TPA: prephenate dehydratase domain-containing protein [Acidobacteriaceae bacterium]|jgi:prephenate dehydratase|nr:prephenate dehydratase domain-containing protein [Acidobacteriaceae bacterium]
MRIAIQGELGSFSHEAALQASPEATILPCTLSADVFAAVDANAADAAVIPIENSLAGSVLEHYDLLLAHPVAVERESLLRIRHNLIAVPGATLDRVRQAWSHPVALAQCRRFFLEHPEIEAAPFYDTAGSVKQLMELRDPGMAAIAGVQAIAQYGGAVLLADIEDNPANFTRFFLIRARERLNPDPHPDKVSLAFSVENRPGSLVAALQVFADLGTNITRLESRPVPGRPWEYVFYADYQLSDPKLADAALAKLPEHCSMVRELGRYRAAAP